MDHGIPIFYPFMYLKTMPTITEILGGDLKTYNVFAGIEAAATTYARHH